MLTRKKIGLITLLASFATGNLMAGNLASYATGDVLICFRKGGNDMVVDAGPIGNFTSLSPNTVYNSFPTYTGTQLAQVGINAVKWSAFTWQSDNTLYVTEARSSLNQQSYPFQCQGSPSQGGTAARMATIPPGALDELNLMVYPVSTATAVVEEDSSSGNPNYTDGVSYGDALTGSYGSRFNGTFVGNPENVTSNNFTAAGVAQRSDFYKMTPTGGYALGQYLGYFQLSTSGVMTYVAYPSTTPVITSITHSGSSTTIYFTTGLYGTYTLRGITSLAAGGAESSWPSIQTLPDADPSVVQSLTFTDTDNIKFYAITAQ